MILFLALAVFVGILFLTPVYKSTRKTALLFLVYFGAYLLLIIINSVNLYLPQHSSGGNDGSAGLGKSIASVAFAILSILSVIGFMWSRNLYKNSPDKATTQFIILFVMLLLCIVPWFMLLG